MANYCDTGEGAFACSTAASVWSFRCKEMMMLSDEAHLHSIKSESFTGNVCNKSISELRDVRRMRTLPSNSFPCNVLGQEY